jgi:hypothetical protein
MDVVALDRVMADPELTARAAGAHPRLEVADETAAAQRRNVAPHSQRDVRRRFGELYDPYHSGHESDHHGTHLLGLRAKWTRECPEK